MYRSDPDGHFWHSSMITERLKQRVVCTSTGTTYRLVGKIVKSLALAQGGDIDYVTLCCRLCRFSREWFEGYISCDV